MSTDRCASAQMDALRHGFQGHGRLVPTMQRLRTHRLTMTRGPPPAGSRGPVDSYNRMKSLKLRNWHAYCSRGGTARARFLFILPLTSYFLLLAAAAHWQNDDDYDAYDEERRAALLSSFPSFPSFHPRSSNERVPRSPFGNGSRHGLRGSEYLLLTLQLSLLASRSLDVDTTRMVELVRGVSGG